MHKRHTVTAVVTGKPVEMGGSLGRREATGRGCMIVTREALATLGMSLKGARIAVQGFGNVGSIAAALMAQAGAIIVAASDKSTALHNPKGLDVEDLIKWVKERRQLAGYTKAQTIPHEQVLTVDCDVLIPAATENVITRKNAPHIKAKIICEGANGPTSAAADKILEDKGVFVIPDILANAGGVTVSYFEWVQDRGGYFWDEETVNRRLEAILVRSFGEAQSRQPHRVIHRRGGSGGGDASAARNVCLMRYAVVAAGGTRMKNSALRAACDDYLSRIRHYAKIEEREVKEARVPPPEDSRLIALARDGEAWTSEQLAELTAQWERDARDVTFVIGDADGLPKEILRRAERIWSLGPLTLPHELARVVVYEQLYRAHTIRRGEPYHRRS